MVRIDTIRAFFWKVGGGIQCGCLYQEHRTVGTDKSIQCADAGNTTDECLDAFWDCFACVNKLAIKLPRLWLILSLIPSLRNWMQKGLKLKLEPEWSWGRCGILEEFVMDNLAFSSCMCSCLILLPKVQWTWNKHTARVASQCRGLFSTGGCSTRFQWRHQCQARVEQTVPSLHWVSECGNLSPVLSTFQISVINWSFCNVCHFMWIEIFSHQMESPSLSCSSHIWLWDTVRQDVGCGWPRANTVVKSKKHWFFFFVARIMSESTPSLGFGLVRQNKPYIAVS